MKIYFLIGFVSVFMFQNCDKEQVTLLHGSWVEKEPVPNRIELIFEDENQLIQKTLESEARNTFTYEIRNDSISLSSNEADTNKPIVVFFKIMNGDELQIGNFTTSGNTNEIIRLRKK